jgi:hypothetical protein
LIDVFAESSPLAGSGVENIAIREKA